MVGALNIGSAAAGPAAPVPIYGPAYSSINVFSMNHNNYICAI